VVGANCQPNPIFNLTSSVPENYGWKSIAPKQDRLMAPLATAASSMEI